MLSKIAINCFTSTGGRVVMPKRAAGTGGGPLVELISPFLQKKIEQAGKNGDTEQKEVLEKMYKFDKQEVKTLPMEHRRHYESGVEAVFEGVPLVGVERLYRKTVLIEPTMCCAAHCRWCLRGQYPIDTLPKEAIARATRWFGSKELRKDVNEILITGGDPLTSPMHLDYTLSQLSKNAPNIKTIRIGSRVVFHDPALISSCISILRKYPQYRYEMGVHACHPCETEWPEAIKAIEDMHRAGIKLYNQNPLLKGVNDNLNTLVRLCQDLRDLDIESHYLFHAIPIVGSNHHRTTVKRGLELATQLDACGKLSGRAKPKYTLLTDIGKIVLFDGAITGHRKSDNSLLIKSGYSLKERKTWNPTWKMPSSAVLGSDGDTMSVWYMDAITEDENN